MVAEVVLLLSNTDPHEQVQDGTRGCSTFAKYWPPWTSSKWYQRLFYFCQILTTMNKFKMVPEVFLLLPNTGHHEQVQDGTRGCSTSVKYWLPWTSSRWYQRLFYFCQILATMNKFKMVPEVVLLLSNTDPHEQVQDGTRGCSTSAKYWPPWTSSRWYQRLFYFCQILTTMNKFKIIPVVVLLLPNTGHHEKVQDGTRGCSISAKYWPPWTSSILFQGLFYCY